MAERSRFWDGSVTGDAVSITDDELMDRFFRAVLNGTGNQGVLPGWLNELEVTDVGGLNASVNTGGAILYGLFYENDAAATVALPNNSTVWVVVRRDWATPQARLTQVAALIQNPGVTYDIPLAQVTTLAGVITLITDGRDYCEFSTLLRENSVSTIKIQDDAVTPAKLENRTRWVVRSAGMLEPDVGSAATWATLSTWPLEPFSDAWGYADAASNSAWMTFRVPDDFVAPTMSIYLWTRNYAAAVSGDVVWAFSSWDAQPSAVLANQTGSATVAVAAGYNLVYRVLLGTMTLAAGDLVHVEVWRDGTNLNDTLAATIYLKMVEFVYTADS